MSEHTIIFYPNSDRYPNSDHQARPTATVSIGVVTGRIQTLSNRNGLRFNLYDAIHDKAVVCYLASHQTELIREAWGCRAAITGRITREAQTGRPTAIRQITAIETLAEPTPGSYRQARAAVPWQPGDLLPEDAIRRLRDTCGTTAMLPSSVSPSANRTYGSRA